LHIDTLANLHNNNFFQTGDTMKKLKNWHITLGVLFIIILAVLSSASGIIENYLNKYAEDIVGRKIYLGDLKINYFKVAIQLKDLDIYEQDGETPFAGFKECYINFTPTKLFNDEYSVSEIRLDSLYVNIIKDGEQFNFDDLIPAEDSITGEKAKKDSAEIIKFSVYNIDFSKGCISFNDKEANQTQVFADLNLKLPLIAWDNQKSEVGIDFKFGNKGKIMIDAEYNVPNQIYNLNLHLDSLEINSFTNYLKPYMNVSTMNGYFHSRTNISGSSRNVNQILITGKSSISDFKLSETEENPFIEFKNFEIIYDAIDMGKSFCYLSKIQLEEPIIHARLDKDFSNFEKVFRPILETDSIPTDSITQTQHVELDSTQIRYKIDSVLLKNGKVLFADNTLNRPFSYEVHDINVKMNNIDETTTSFPIQFALNLHNQGLLYGEAVVNPSEPMDITINATIERLKVLSFSPYSEFYMARPITQGEFTYKLKLDMDKHLMTNHNSFKISDLEFGSNTGDTTAINVPIQLALYILKDQNDVITFDLPVYGNPSEPGFRASKLIWKSMKNFMIKTAASPFKALGSLVGTNPEKLENIPFAYAQDSLNAEQKNTLRKIAEITKKKPNLRFTLRQQTHPEVEKQYLALEIIKDQSSSSHLKKEIIRDSSQYADNNRDAFVVSLGKVDDNSVQNASAHEQIIGEQQLNAAFDKLLNHRNQLIEDFMFKEMQVDSSSIEIQTADLINLPEELKTTNYKVEVSVK